MKKLIPMLLLVGGVPVFAQLPTTVNFNNNVLPPPVPYVYDVDGVTRLSGTNMAAQLYYGANGAPVDSLIAVTTAPARFRSSTSASIGTWAGGTRTLTGFSPGDTITLQVRVWDTSFGNTYETRTGGNFGQSAPFPYLIPPGPQPIPTTAYYISNFQSFSLVPEPSVMGLGLVGIGALFLLRRRKV
jgi:MYXO-CTERM domain-containing protein